MNVRTATYDLMRKLGLTTVFGNPGSTEETFLKDFPNDFTYVLALQEASVLAIADGYAQASGTVGFVNVHTAPGLGNALGNLVNTSMSKTPMIVTTGQQAREMVLMEPWLTNVDATTFPKPHVKWAYETTHAQESPAALMRAYAAAVQPPQGPVYLSLPLNDWEEPASGEAILRETCTRVGPDPERLTQFADKLNRAKHPALVMGADIDRAGAWSKAIALAEEAQCSVFAPPASERCGFPEDHRLFVGGLPFGIAPLSKKLEGFDLVLVIGAPVFRYYPYIPGDYLPSGCELLHITNDPNEAARAPVGNSLISDSALALDGLLKLVTRPSSDRFRKVAKPDKSTSGTGKSMTVDAMYAAIAKVRPEHLVIVEESPSNLAVLHEHLPIRESKGFFTMASGGLGFGLPASVGVALAERATKRERPVLAVIGDGSFQYSVQSIWTAAQQKTRQVIVVPDNQEYAILKAFAKQEKTPGVPGLDVPGIDISALASAYGCRTVRASSPDDVSDHVKEAFQHDGPTVVVARIDSTVPPLL